MTLAAVFVAALAILGGSAYAYVYAVQGIDAWSTA